MSLLEHFWEWVFTSYNTCYRSLHLYQSGDSDSHLDLSNTSVLGIPRTMGRPYNVVLQSKQNLTLVIFFHLLFYPMSRQLQTKYLSWWIFRLSLGGINNQWRYIISSNASGLIPKDLEKVSTSVLQWSIRRNYWLSASFGLFLAAALNAVALLLNQLLLLRVACINWSPALLEPLL